MFLGGGDVFLLFVIRDVLEKGVCFEVVQRCRDNWSPSDSDALEN